MARTQTMPPAQTARPPASPGASPPARLIISSRNYSSWSLRGWMMVRLSGLPFTTERISNDDRVARAELLQQTSSIRIPSLEHQGVVIWDVLAIGEYLHEICPQAGLLPDDLALRSRCRAVSGEMHGGFAAMRSALPVNLHAFRPNFPIWTGVRADIERISEIWRSSLNESGGPFLFGTRMGLADAMFAPVCTRFATYDVDLDSVCAAYRDRVLARPEMVEWIAEAKREPELVSELEVVDGEF